MVSDKTAQLIAQLNKIDRSTIDQNDTDIAEIQAALFAAHRRVQSPFDTAMDVCWTKVAAESATRTLIHVGLFEKWVAKGGQPASGQELADLTGFDVVLLERLLRFLAGQRYIDVTGDSTYALTRYSRALADPKFNHIFTFGSGFIAPVFSNFPKFAKDIAYQNPTDLLHSNYQSRYGPDATVFGGFKDDPELGTAFNDSMMSFAMNKTSWTEIYSTDEIVSALKPGQALVVDVGGGNGHDLERFRARHSDVPQGSLILQDLPEVADAAVVKAPIVAQAHDMMTPQPIKGARVYFLHNILHDWPDDQSAEILRNVAKGMEKGYSKILLNENVIQPKGSHPLATTMDMCMLMIFSSVERTEAHWKELIARVPELKLVKIWTAPQAVESVLELELA